MRTEVPPAPDHPLGAPVQAVPPSRLWVYAQNDHFFSPQLAVEFYRAFTTAGGRAQFVSAGPFGTDGHRLFSEVGSLIWMPMVDAFLQKQSLVLRKTFPPQAEPGGAEPPNH